MSWDYIRGQFPAAEKLTYLDSAAAGLVSRDVAEEGSSYYKDLLSGKHDWQDWQKRIREVRQNVARLIGADEREIAFVPNTSYGMSFIAEMLKGRGRVITMKDEFPSSTIPWLNRGFNMTFLKPEEGKYPISCIKKQLTFGPKILVTSHVQFATGFKQDLVELGKLCRRESMQYVVNATQSAGAVEIDVKAANVDFLAFSGVKWMCAGEGFGALYISKKWHKLGWPVVGWMSAKEPMDMDNRNLDFKNGASVLEGGAPLLPNIFVLGKAVDLMLKIGVSKVEERIRELTGLLIEKLQKLNVEFISPLEKEDRAGIVTIKTKDPNNIVKQLHKKGIIVSTRRGGLRISPHMYNNEADIERFVSEFKKMI